MSKAISEFYFYTSGTKSASKTKGKHSQLNVVHLERKKTEIFVTASSSLPAKLNILQITSLIFTVNLLVNIICL